MAFSWYMTGWISHDFQHHAVIKGTSTQLVAWNVLALLLGSQEVWVVAEAWFMLGVG